MIYTVKIRKGHTFVTASFDDAQSCMDRWFRQGHRVTVTARLV